MKNFEKNVSFSHVFVEMLATTIYVHYSKLEPAESVPAPDGTSSSLRPARELRVFLECSMTILVYSSEGHACTGKVCS